MNRTIHIYISAVATWNVSPLFGCQVIDGYKTEPGNLVLLPRQKDDSENGVWIVREGYWVRPEGILYLSTSGQTFGDTLWLRTGKNDWIRMSESKLQA